MSARPLPLLSALEARALAVLVEKERTVPDTYPLTLNALTAGCNQKSSRNPLFNATESEVQAAIDTLKRYSLVIESSGGRVMRYAQNVKRVFELPSQSIALLATLVLRGPQTAGELRINSDRLNRFSDISAVEGFLNEMAERPAGALVVELPRQPGARETRWVHLLSGAPVGIDETGSAMGYGSTAGDGSVAPSGSLGPGGAAAPRGPASGIRAETGAGGGAILSFSDAAVVNARVAALEAEVAMLRRTVEQLCAELGLASPATPGAGAGAAGEDTGS